MRISERLGEASLNAVRLAPLAVLWVWLAPMTFTVLYSVIELQAEARSAVGENGRLATFKTVLLAEKLAATETRQQVLIERQQVLNDGLKALVGQRSRAELGLDTARVRLEDVVQSRSSAGPAAAGSAYMALEDLVRETRRGLVAAGRAGDREAGEALADLDKRYRDYQAARTALIEIEGEVKQLAEAAGTTSGELEKGRAATYAEDERALLPVANSYLTLTRRPVGSFVEDFFTLPASALVALFTALMGAVGAAVGSLAVEVGLTRPQERMPAYRAYLVRPVLGGMAGFMVFFVVSAGTTFLIRPAGDESAGEAANQLSPAALASMGVFAGLASEAAIAWLRARASAFFRTDDPRRGGDAGRTTPGGNDPSRADPRGASASPPTG